MKKIISSILLCFMLFLVGISGVSAATKDVEITEFKLQSKSSTATVENVSLDDNNKVTGTIALNKVDDFVSFNLTIKNNSNDKFKIIKIEDNNKIDNITLVYQYDENFIESGQSSSVTIKLRYDKELSGQSKLSLDDLNIKINFEKENGARQSIVVNPKTGDSIIRFVIIGIVSLVGAFLLVVKRKRKIGMLLLILASIILPFAALANEKYEINIKFANIDIMGKEEEKPVTPDYATLKDGNTFNSLISSGTGVFRKTTEEEYNAVKDSLNDSNIASTNGSPAPVYLWNSNGDILYYSEAPVIYMNEDAGNMFKDVNLTTIDLSGLDSSKVTDMSYMFANLKGTTFVDLSKLDTSGATTMVGMFTGIGHSGLDLSTFDTSNVVNMSGMFSHSETLEEVNLSSFNTSKVTDMSNMFNGSSMLTGLDLNNFNTSKVTNMSGMFNACSSLINLNINSFDTSKVTDMSSMFAGCSKMDTIDVSSFNTSKVTDMTSMFENCTKLETIYASNLWDMTGVQNSDDMFKGDENLLGQEGTEYDPSNNSAHYACLDEGVNDPGYFSEVGHESSVYATLVKGTVFKSKLETIIRYYTSLKRNDLLGVNFDAGEPRVDDSGSNYGCDSSSESSSEYGCDSGCGCGCGGYSESGGSGSGSTSACSFDLSSPENGFYCEYSAPGMGSESPEVEITRFRKATKTEYKNAKYFLDRKFMVSTSNSPKPVYLWVEGDSVVYYSVVKKIYLNQDSSYMFDGSAYVSTDFVSIDLSGLDSSHVTDMSSMFNYEESLKNVNLDGFDTSNVTNMSSMFAYCTSLKELDLSSFTLESIEYTESMFYDDSALETIYVSDEWDPHNYYEQVGCDFGEPGISFSYSMFGGCTSLVGQMGTSYNTNFHGHDTSLFAVIDGKDERYGYLSSKNADMAKFIPGEDFNNKITAMNTAGKSFRKATTAEYNSVSESLNDENNLVSVNSKLPIYIWETNESVLYYSSKTNLYLNENASSMFKNTGFVSIDLGGINIVMTTNMSSMFEGCSSLTTIKFEDSTPAQVANIINNSNLSANVMNNNGTMNIVPIIFAIIFVVVALGIGVLLFRGVKIDKLKLSVGFIVVIAVVISLSVLLWDSGFKKLLASVSTPEESNVTTAKIDTKKVTDMSSMFKNCTSLVELDISPLDVEDLDDASYMFYNCSSLETIYASESWDLIMNGSMSYYSDYDMFYNCVKLKGQKGTVYDPEFEYEPACIDKGYKFPGYFSLKGETYDDDYAYFIDGYSFYEQYEEIEDIAAYSCSSGCGSHTLCNNYAAKHFRKATETEYNNVKSSLTSVNVVSAPKSPKKIYMWQLGAEGDMVYYSEASKIYLNSDASSMFTANSEFITIDLSGIDCTVTSNVDRMFYRLSHLTTIYVSEDWPYREQGYDGWGVFNGCTSLVGGAGTAYDGSDAGLSRAHVDGGPSKPGYFTLKE